MSGPRLVVGVVATAALLASGCGNRGGLLGKPQQTRNASLSVPYIVGDVVPDLPVKATFARTGWVLVDDGTSTFRTGLEKPGLSVVGRFVDDSNPVRYNQLHRLAFDGRAIPFGIAKAVDPGDLEDLDITPPASWVWLFGPEGPCRATVGAPFVGRAYRDVRVLEVSYALQGCQLTRQRWAPVASVADSMPADVTWTEATITEPAQFGEDEKWNHPLADHTTRPTAEDQTLPARYVGQARVVGGLQPLPAQAIVTGVWEDPQDACKDREMHDVVLGWWDRYGVAPLELALSDDAGTPLLVGALVQAGDPQALLFARELDALLAVVPVSAPKASDDAIEPSTEAGLDPGPETWTVHQLATGSWTDAEQRAADYTTLGDCTLPTDDRPVSTSRP